MLENIHVNNCPHCNAGIKRDLKENQHCNGNWNETRTFDCGFSLHFSPNYNKIIDKENGVCTRNIEYKKKIENINKAKNEISTFISKIKYLDEKEKEKFINDIKNTYFSKYS